MLKKNCIVRIRGSKLIKNLSNLQNKSWWFQDVDIFDDVGVRFDISTGESLSTMVRTHDDYRATHSTHGAFKRKVAVYEHLSFTT